MFCGDRIKVFMIMRERKASFSAAPYFLIHSMVQIGVMALLESILYSAPPASPYCSSGPLAPSLFLLYVLPHYGYGRFA